jgi:formate dehydrogenase (coenzyme F420) beta subunit
MTNFTKISYQKESLNVELSKLFKGLIEKQVVNAILAPAVQSSGLVMQTLIVDPAMTDSLDPFAPVIPVSSAKIASSLTTIPSGKKIALVMRSCEIRALIELVKLNQANLDDILLIGLDCFGRFENKEFFNFQKQGLTTESFIQSAQSGQTETNGFEVIDACKMCPYPVADNVDIRLCLVGSDSGSFGVESISEKGQKALDYLELAGSELPSKRTDAIKNLVNKRQEELKLKLEEYQENKNTIKALEETMAKCINCYNCRVACPVCYCKECVFVTDTFRHEGEQFLGWAQKEGTLKMPTDTVFYHLTRMTHIGHLCVGCGQCTSACPNDINLTLAFKAAAKASQERFEYEAGRSLTEKQPLTVFHNDELVEVTGQVK